MGPSYYIVPKRDALRRVQPLVGDKASIQCEARDALVRGIRYDDLIVQDENACCVPSEFAGASSRTSNGADISACGIENSDVLSETVGDVDVSLSIDVDTGDAAELIKLAHVDATYRDDFLDGPSLVVGPTALCGALDKLDGPFTHVGAQPTGPARRPRPRIP